MRIYEYGIDMGGANGSTDAGTLYEAETIVESEGDGPMIIQWGWLVGSVHDEERDVARGLG